MGRPRLNPETVRCNRIVTFVTNSELAKLEQKADQEREFPSRRLSTEFSLNSLRALNTLELKISNEAPTLSFESKKWR